MIFRGWNDLYILSQNNFNGYNLTESVYMNVLTVAMDDTNWALNIRSMQVLGQDFKGGDMP